MAIASETAYNIIFYPGQALAQAHPDRSATLAALHGVYMPHPATCRILELGCGDGTNLISVAQSLPEAMCVGIDLAESGIKKGKTCIQQLGLKNIQLQQYDVLEIDDNFGQFDFIIAHGLYSWVPEHVRDKILSICKTNLAEKGVAYISYNTYPGAYLRNMVRDMMRYHVGEMETAQQKIEQARAFVEFIADSARDDSEVYRPLLMKERERIRGFLDSSLFHDDLADCNAPVYFSEFMAHAARHGLQYLSEAQFFETQAGIFPSDVVEVLNRISDSRIAKEQYLDFLKGRRFRQTLLCHAGNNVIASPNAEAIMQFYIAAPVYPEVQPLDINAPELVIFKGPKNSAIQTDNPLIKAALSRLGSIWPRALHFRELFNEAYNACAIKPDRSESEKALADMLLRAYAGAVVEFHLMPSDFIVQPGEYPVASPLARLQSLSGNKVTNLRHYTIRIEDPVGHHLLQLLDGSRNRADLVDALSQWVDSENVDFLKQATENRSSKAIREKVADQLETSLTELGHLALLTA